MFVGLYKSIKEIPEVGFWIVIKLYNCKWNIYLITKIIIEYYIY